MFDELNRMKIAIERAIREIDYPMLYLTEAFDALERAVLDAVPLARDDDDDDDPGSFFLAVEPLTHAANNEPALNVIDKALYRAVEHLGVIPPPQVNTPVNGVDTDDRTFLGLHARWPQDNDTGALVAVAREQTDHLKEAMHTCNRMIARESQDGRARQPAGVPYAGTARQALLNNSGLKAALAEESFYAISFGSPKLEKTGDGCTCGRSLTRDCRCAP